MNNKGFTEEQFNIETPNGVNIAEKPLNYKENIVPRVDINVLKSKLHESENKELRKNLIVLSSLILALGLLGIYLSL